MSGGNGVSSYSNHSSFPIVAGGGGGIMDRGWEKSAE